MSTRTRTRCTCAQTQRAHVQSVVDASVQYLPYEYCPRPAEAAGGVGLLPWTPGV